MQLISTDQTVRDNTIQDLKDFNQQSLSTQAKKGEQLTSMMPAIKKAFNLLGDDIIELSTENDVLKNQIGEYDQKWLEESKRKLLKDIDDEKRSNLIMSRMKKQMNKKWNIFIIVFVFYKWLTYLIIDYGKVNLMELFLKEMNYRFQILMNWNSKFMILIKKMKN